MMKCRRHRPRVISRPWSSCKNNGSATENVSKTTGTKRRRRSEEPAPRNYWRGAKIQPGRSRVAYAVSNNRQTNVAVASNSAPAITNPQVFAPLACRWLDEISDALTYPTPPFLVALYVIVLMPLLMSKSQTRLAHSTNHASQPPLNKSLVIVSKIPIQPPSAPVFCPFTSNECPKTGFQQSPGPTA